MPFTLAHPAAVLPLRRFKYLPMVPLLIGSITPDLPYYAPGRMLPVQLASITHTFVGSVTVDAVLGLAVLAFGLGMRRPLTALMSVRARSLYLSAMDRFRARPLHWLVAVPSIVIGSWTHILWDSFTHQTGWMVQRVSALSAPVSIFGWYTGELCHVLQYVSSAFGLAVLIFCYLRLPAPVPEPASAGTRSRVPLMLLLVCVAAVIIGGLVVLPAFGHVQVYRLIYLLLTRTIAWFAVLYVAAGILVTFMSNRRAQPELQS